MHKGMFPADHVPLWPPIFPPGMIAFGDQHIVEALGFLGLLADPEDFQFVHALQVENNATLFGIDLQALTVLPATSKARRFQRT